MTLPQILITLAMCALATAITRFLPFLIFSSKRPTPQFVLYLGKVLPGAIFSMLVVYCLKNVTPLQYSYGLPELIAILLTAGLHLWKRQILLSIAAGTVCYMLLIQMVFVA
ncbi:MAG: branched-chain amino acid transporter permease [Oscillibacter sp.]|nr:branched-chain amino acid transporter permease [Oscillibacter sp.]